MFARRNHSARTVSLGVLGLALLGASTLPVAAPIEERGVLLLAPVVRSIEGTLRPVSSLVLAAGETKALAAENARLRLENAELAGEAAALRERVLATTQVEALLAGAGGGRALGKYVGASVIVRDPAPGHDVLVVRGGRDIGLAEGQPALGPGATLVGIVTRVEEHTARIRLLTDRASAVSALLERSREPAALSGGRDGLHLEFVPTGTPGVEGDTVLTSALGGQLPAGIPIGRVVAVESVEGDLFQRVRVEPLADYRRLEHVLVLVDPRPTDTPTEAALGSGPR